VNVLAVGTAVPSITLPSNLKLLVLKVAAAPVKLTLAAIVAAAVPIVRFAAAFEMFPYPLPVQKQQEQHHR